MNLANYSFLTIWQFDAPIGRVWDVIIDAARYPEWWKYVASVEAISPGDERGVGLMQRTRWTTALPYGFIVDMRVVRSDPPHLLELLATGDLEGVGRWELSEDAGGTTVRYTWQVRTTRLWMNMVAPFIRRAALWNHDVMMTEGGESLARLIGVRLLRNESSYVGATAGGAASPMLRGFAVGAGAAIVARRSLRGR